MKRSTLSLALFYAALGFAGTAAVRFAAPLQADNAPGEVSPDAKVSTKTFDLTVRYNQDAASPEVVATNTTNQPQTAEWHVRVLSSGPIRSGSRVMPMPKEVSNVPVSVTLAPHESQVVAIDLPKQSAKSNKQEEAISVLITTNGQSLRVPTAAVRMTVLAKE